MHTSRMRRSSRTSIEGWTCECMFSLLIPPPTYHYNHQEDSLSGHSHPAGTSFTAISVTGAGWEVTPWIKLNEVWSDFPTIIQVLPYLLLPPTTHYPLLKLTQLWITHSLLCCQTQKRPPFGCIGQNTSMIMWKQEGLRWCITFKGKGKEGKEERREGTREGTEGGEEGRGRKGGGGREGGRGGREGGRRAG